MRTNTIRTLAAIVVAAALSGPAAAEADLVKVKSDASVADTAARLQAAVEKAGAKVFAVVDHQAGAKTADVELSPMTLVILGNPKIGAPAMLESQTMGLDVPLRVLVYEDAEGDVWLTYHDPAAVAADHGIAPDHPAVVTMQGALGKLTGAAAGG